MKMLMIDRNGTPQWTPPYGAGLAVVEPPTVVAGPEGDPVLVLVVEAMTSPVPPAVLGALHMAR